MTEDYPVPADLVERFVAGHVYGLPWNVDEALIAAGAKKRPGPLKVSTIRRRLVGLIKEHEARGLDNTFRTPRLKALLIGARRYELKNGVQRKWARAIVATTLDRMIDTWRSPKSLTDLRNIAMLALAFYSGGRRSAEIRFALAENLVRFRGGYKYWLHISKTDQAGKGSEKIIRWPHARHIERWLTASGIRDGYLFRRVMGDTITADPVGKNTLTDVIKSRIEAIGEDPRHYSAHSLRRGFLTQCGIEGVPFSEAMECSGHKDVKTAMLYYQQGTMEQNRATKIHQHKKKSDRQPRNQTRHTGGSSRE